MKKLLGTLFIAIAMPSFSNEHINAIPIFNIGNSFEQIKQNYELKPYISNTNVIPDLKSYKLDLERLTIYLDEWKGKLHEINYNLHSIPNEDSIEIAKFLFKQYSQNLNWIEEGYNDWGIWYELSDHSIHGYNVYSLGERTVSFVSFEKLEEIGRIKYPEK